MLLLLALASVGKMLVAIAAEYDVMLVAVAVMLHVHVAEKLVKVTPKNVACGVSIVVAFHSIVVLSFESWEKASIMLVSSI